VESPSLWIGDPEPETFLKVGTCGTAWFSFCDLCRATQILVRGRKDKGRLNPNRVYLRFVGKVFCRDQHLACAALIVQSPSLWIADPEPETFLKVGACSE
jgi:hypothetical protein